MKSFKKTRVNSKYLILLFAVLMLLSAIAPKVSFAGETPLENVPYLESVEFSNAKIDGDFVSSKTEYTLILDTDSATPVLSNYKISGNADMFLNYIYDETYHQTGLTITLNFENGSVIYTFKYGNVREYKITGNANLSAIECEGTEIQPKINSRDTNYKLYIPKDATELDITPVTEDVNAYCAPVSLKLNETQEPKITLAVKASDGTIKSYSLQVKRVDKTTAEIKEEMASPDYVSFVNGELFYQKPQFLIAVCAAGGGIVLIALLLIFTKRIIANPFDKDEKEFYLITEVENKEETESEETDEENVEDTEELAEVEENAETEENAEIAEEPKEKAEENDSKEEPKE